MHNPIKSAELQIHNSACESASIECRTNQDCTVTCQSDSNDYYSCRAATIDCPAFDKNSCAVTCASSSNNNYGGCIDLSINWNPESVSNTLICDESCLNVPYPPSLNDSTRLSVNCDGDAECYGTIITCPLNAPCTVSCSGQKSCSNAIINCPSDAPCNIECSNTDSCKHMVVNCPTDDECQVACSATTTCQSTTINWISDSLSEFDCPDPDNCIDASRPPQMFAVPADNFADYTLVCDEDNECAGAIITCPTNADCSIQCTARNSCGSAKILCPANGECAVKCNAISACRNTHIEWVNDQPNSLDCGAFDSSCYGVHFKPYNQNVAFSQDCSKASNMCYGATFDCPQNAPCIINCQGVTASATAVCKESIVNGPSKHPLTMTCNQGIHE